ncbi:MAG: TAXI family TRAP transporter solute-binding subunit [Burkholderiaceae bacterium]
MLFGRTTARLLTSAAFASTLVAVSLTAQAADFKWPDYFSVVTPRVGTANHSLAVAWSSKFTKSTGVKVAVKPAPNGFARAQWLNTNEGQVALFQASDYFDQMDAVQGYATKDAGPSDTRMLNMNMVTPWGYAVRGDSKIKTIDDIGPGTRIALTKSSSFLVSGINALLAYRNLKPTDVTLVEVGNYGANTAVLVEGRVDVTFTSPISGTSVKAEAGPNGLRWIELPPVSKDPAAFSRYRNIMAGYVPAKTVSGVKSAVGLNMDHAYQANHVRADADPEFVYQLIKWLDENHDSYKGDFTHAHLMNINNIVAFLEGGAMQPLHEGTIRYLQEKKLWKPAHQARQDQLVTLASKRIAAFQAAVEQATKRGIKMDPADEAWQKLLVATREKNGLMEPFSSAVLSLK